MIKIFWDFTATGTTVLLKGLSDDKHASEKFKYSFNAKCKHTFWFLSALLSLYWLELAFNHLFLLYEKSCCITTDSQVLWQQQVLGAFTTMQLSSNAGVNKLAFKWIIIWEKFPQNGLWGRVSSRRRRVAKLFPRESYHPPKANGKISSQGRVSLP